MCISILFGRLRKSLFSNKQFRKRILTINKVQIFNCYINGFNGISFFTQYISNILYFEKRMYNMVLSLNIKFTVLIVNRYFNSHNA